MIRQFEARLGLAASILMAAIALALSLPISLVLAALFVDSDIVSSRQLFYALVIVGPAAMAISIWLSKFHRILIRNGVAAFFYTRYGIPRHVEISKDDLLRAVYVDGMLSVDGRPRPLIEYEMRSGASGWVPFTLYSRSVIREAIHAMLENGLHVENGPR